MAEHINNYDRRKFLQQTAIVSVGALLANPVKLFASSQVNNISGANIKLRAT
jgi:hypothetical protein